MAGGNTKAAKEAAKTLEELNSLLPDGVILSAEITPEQIENAVSHFNELSNTADAALEAENKSLKSEAESLKSQLVDLSSQLAISSKVGTKPSFQVEGKTYTISHGVTVVVRGEPTRFSAAEIANNTEVQNILVSQKSAAIKLVV